MNSLVTVIVPVYNVEIYLKKCIESILYQTYENIEIILVDDGSTDNSGAICDEYLHKDSRIIVIHKDNGGLGSARNAALDVCNGEYISFVDSDDWIEKDFIESLTEYASSDTVTCCGYNEVFPDKVVNNDVDEFYKCTSLEFVELLLDYEIARANGSKNNPIGNYMCNKLWPKQCFANLRFPCCRFEDIYVSMDLILKTKKAVVIPGSKYNYLQRSGSIIYSQKSNIDCLNAFLKQEEILKTYDLLRKKVEILSACVATTCLRFSVGTEEIRLCKNIVKSRLKFDILKYHRIALKIYLFLYVAPALRFLYKR